MLSETTAVYMRYLKLTHGSRVEPWFPGAAEMGEGNRYQVSVMQYKWVLEIKMKINVLIGSHERKVLCIGFKCRLIKRFK